MDRSITRCHTHRKAVLHDGGGEAKLRWELGASRLQVVGAQDMCRQRLDLNGGKVNPNAESRTTSEGDQAIGCTPVLLSWRREAVGIECLWIGKHTGQMVTRSQS